MIEVKGISVKLGDESILEEIDLQIKSGEISVIVGQSGCGKSVLMKTIEALFYPFKGEVLIDSCNIHKSSRRERKELRKKMAMLFQGSALLDSLNIFQNIALPIREHKKLQNKEIYQIVEENLSMVGLKNIMEKYPSELSGGMKKRVAIARAMVLKPEYIIFDEPTTGLDPITAKEIISLILKLFNESKITPIIVTHDLNLIDRVYGRIIMLADKKKIFDGTYEEFKQSNDNRILNFLGKV